MKAAELPPVLRALIESRSEWRTVQDLADDLGVDIPEAAAAIGRQVEEGYLEVSWTNPGLPAVTFTEWGQAVLGLERSDVDAVHVFKWVLTGKPRKPPRRRVPREYVAIEEVEDPSGGPVERAIAHEEEAVRAAGRQARRERRGLPLRHDDVPSPTIILTGPELVPWDEARAKSETRPARTCPRCSDVRRRRKVLRMTCECGRGTHPSAQGTCPACHGADLPRSTYCARCRNWGWDSYFAPKREVDDDHRTSHPTPA